MCLPWYFFARKSGLVSSSSSSGTSNKHQRYYPNRQAERGRKALSRQEAGHIRMERATQATDLVSELGPDLTATQVLLVENAAEKGVSSWVMAVPSSPMQMVHNKSDFRDAFSIRYGLQPDGLPLTCVCGAANTIDHAMMCPAVATPWHATTRSGTCWLT